MSHGVRLEDVYVPTGRLSLGGDPEECLLAPPADLTSPGAGTLQLNRAGAFVWNRLDGAASGADIVEALVAEFDVERARAEHDYRTLLARLLQLGAVRRADPPA